MCLCVVAACKCMCIKCAYKQQAGSSTTAVLLYGAYRIMWHAAAFAAATAGFTMRGACKLYSSKHTFAYTFTHWRTARADFAGRVQRTCKFVITIAHYCSTATVLCCCCVAVLLRPIKLIVFEAHTRVKCMQSPVKCMRSCVCVFLYVGTNEREVCRHVGI